MRWFYTKSLHLFWELDIVQFMGTDTSDFSCGRCGKVIEENPPIDLCGFSSEIQLILMQGHPNLTMESHICKLCRNEARIIHVRRAMESESRELSELQLEVLDSLETNTLVSRTEAQNAPETFGVKMADAVASFGGSWKFIGLFSLVLAGWIVFNSAMGKGAFDPYPFILMNLILSTLAAIQAPIIMMSQNRQEDKDRERSESDYRVNLKAELELRLLHEKVDHLLYHHMQNLNEIQDIQLEYLKELTERKK